ncbi:carbamoyltransferase HypF [Wenzhouxiangella sp. XN24]|uniref:carbamoyltransferase HypF n=1 Tax=Wenzhouxiangella sp. XN24 TaxID=2713569 RepID=UPI0013EA790A|nr:carbamoyltransferase HypF [Wenzhouxiangella sp. XN24]NGX15394.1 carbamoyltransferase HypF [Wenzhouxiangella sp. XN24]
MPHLVVERGPHPGGRLSPGRRLWITGHVQGVGFRPFLYRLADQHGLTGWARNTVGEVEVLVCGQPAAVDDFTRDVISAAPAIAAPRLRRVEDWQGPPPQRFEILASEAGATPRIFVPPDYFTCNDCLRELADPADRRYRYPFINCTQCGPRYTLIEALPYDRANTSMAGFALCLACRREYTDPADRRFHAEPIACPDCGPKLHWTAMDGGAPQDGAAALDACIAALKAGRLVAVKGVGGYHLVCDAADTAAIARLRRLKPRPTKPLAVMAPLAGEDGLAAVRRIARPTEDEARLLLSPQRPIVLLGKRAGALPDALAPGLAELGVMLPYSPLHALLLDALDRPLVATSANISGEPVLTAGEEVEDRLAHLAEGCLHHDRPIVRPADDPVWRRTAGRVRPLRTGRGGAPVELTLTTPVARPVLATGAHMKNTIALAWGDRCVVSPHIGDMGAERSMEVFEQVGTDLQALYGVRAEALVCDAHPAYATTRWARRAGLPVSSVLHHHAHAAALAAEMATDDPVLIFAWDGVGYGGNGELWGGEAFLGRPGAWRRVASFRPFHLPGGERAGREPWRSAAALCWESGRDWPECPDRDGLARGAWERRLNTPATSAVGRLFDAAAALSGVCLHADYEGEGPMRLEAAANEVLAADGAPTRGAALPLAPDTDGVLRADWAPLVEPLLDASCSVGERAAGFHESLARTAVAIATTLGREQALSMVGATGGVLQNRRLADRMQALFGAAGIELALPERLPANDACISFGQVVEQAAADAQRG